MARRPEGNHGAYTESSLKTGLNLNNYKLKRDNESVLICQ